MKVLGVDFGWKRIGLALGDTTTKIATPLETAPNDFVLFDKLKSLIEEHEIEQIVVGLPRGLEGQHTRQTDDALAFVASLRSQLQAPVDTIDEALTSEAAKERLGDQHIKGGAVDMEAAAIILQDYLDQ